MKKISVDLSFLDDFKLFCEENRINYIAFIDKYSNLDENGLTNEMIKAIVKNTNGKWKADWTDFKQKKMVSRFYF